MRLWIHHRKCLTNLTSQTYCLKESNASVGSQVEEIVFWVSDDWLTFIAIIVHVEPFATEKYSEIFSEMMSNIFLLWVSLTPGGTVLTDSSLSPAVQSLTLSSDQLVSCGLLVLQPPEGAPCLLERSLNTSCSNHTISWCCSGVKNQVLCLLHRTIKKLKSIFLYL